jgi:hypothetical protein
MAYSPDATSMVLGAFISAINSDLRRRARKRKLRGRLQTGSLTVVQRLGSSLNLNVHFHVIAMDGVFTEQSDGSMLFHPLPAPRDEDIARTARAVCRKVTRHLGRLTGEDKDDQLTLDHLANAAVQGLVATGARRGCRVLRLGGTGEDAMPLPRPREIWAYPWQRCIPKSTASNRRSGRRLEPTCRFSLSRRSGTWAHVTHPSMSRHRNGTLPVAITIS